MKRIILFLITNIAVLVVVSAVFLVFGLDQGLAASGGFDMGGLLIAAAVIGFSGSLISLFLSKSMAKHAMGVQVIDRPTTQFETWLLNVVARQAGKAGIRMPEVGVFDAPEPNAFATGWNRNVALVAVSTGLLSHMSQEEVEAVVGHEISHVANGDMVTLALIQGVVNTFVVFFARVIGYFVDRVVLKNDGRVPGIGYLVASILAELMLSILATMIVMWFSRHREYRADAGGASLTSRRQMANALRALQRVHEPRDLPRREFAAFGISGKIAEGFAGLFRSHPPLEKRIAALERGSL